MAQGRKPVPTALKLIKGTDQPCRMNKNEPKPKADRITMPAGLSPEAKKHWKQVIKHLKDAKIMTNLDVPALMIYCEAYAQWKDATDKINDHGAIIRGQNGPARSPYLMVAQKAFDQMKQMLTEFGMTPSSRTKISTNGEDDPHDDPWSKL